MAFYTQRRVYKSFVYRNVKVVLYMCVKGATHCGLEHDPKKHMTCQNPKCGARLSHSDVFNIAISGHFLHGVDFADEKTAKDMVQQIIDKNLDQQGDHDGELIDEDPNDDQDILLNEPPPGMPTNKNGGKPIEVDGNTIKKMDKLGWLDWATMVVANRPQKK